MFATTAAFPESGHAGFSRAAEWCALEQLFACRPCYDTAVSLWPKASIELWQGARVVLKNGE
jgi:hypothetical protein